MCNTRLEEIEKLLSALEILCDDKRNAKVLGIRCIKCLQISQIHHMRHCFACNSNLDITCYNNHKCGFEYDL